MIRSLPPSLALWLCASACTIDAGHGFATMTEGELHMRLDVSRARDLGDGAFLTDQGYRVALNELTLRAERLTLLELQGGGGGETASFDPANPPAGFTLCHGGHCHADDGSLVDYEDIQAMLAGGSASFEPLVTVPVDHTFELLEGDRVALTDFAPSAELPQGSIDRLEIAVARLRVVAEIEGEELSDPVLLDIELPLEVVLAQTLSVAIDRDGADELALDAALRFDATMLDGLDLAAFVEDGSIVDDDRSVADALLEWLARADTEIHL